MSFDRISRRKKVLTKSINSLVLKEIAQRREAVGPKHVNKIKVRYANIKVKDRY